MRTTIHKLNPKMNLLKIHTFILIFFSVFTLLSCSNDDESTFIPQDITPVLIVKGNNYNETTQQNIKVSNSTQWNDLKETLGSHITATFSETEVDFTQFDVLVCIEQLRGYLGASIEMTSIIEYEENIKVNVVSINPDWGFAEVTTPYHIVKIPKTSKPVVFEVIEE